MTTKRKPSDWICGHIRNDAEGDTDELLRALGHIAKAWLPSPGSLGAKPRADTSFLRVIRALGVRLHTEAA